MAMTIDKHTEEKGEESNGSVAPLGRRFLWVETPSGLNLLILGLIVLCVILFVFDFVYHRHTKVPYEGLYGFYAIAGFVSFTVIVLCARLLRLLIRRDESYYAPDGVDAEEYPQADTQRLNHEQRIPDSVGSLIEQIAGRNSGDRS
ncbi:MAG: hypothetical protein KTR32_08595 [Granulosicoccus sp.]|nr:hypothetical protein [Granulosicoccus sp.]